MHPPLKFQEVPEISKGALVQNPRNPFRSFTAKCTVVFPAKLQLHRPGNFGNTALHNVTQVTNYLHRSVIDRKCINHHHHNIKDFKLVYYVSNHV